MEVPENIHILSRSVTRFPISAMPRFLVGRRRDQMPLLISLVSQPVSPTHLRERIGALVEIGSRQGRAGVADHVAATSILTQILRSIDSQDCEAARPDPRILRMLRRLHEPHDHELDRLTVTQLADLASMGESAFRAAFVRTTGESPHGYLERLRIERAARLLLDGDSPISEVAGTVGYSDQYHFSRVFKRVKGRPPSVFRRLARGGADDAEAGRHHEPHPRT
ncbi:MAG: helix-turn-helix transcriptional regulator [Solirubrobacteraceae bacterium]